MSFTVLWLIWGGLFAGIEGAAAFNKKPGDTLSEHVWRWVGLRDKPKGWRYRRAGLFAFLAWLLIHLVTGEM